MDPDKDNANPTILNPSDLPSRRRESSAKKREDGGTGLFDDLIPVYTYLNDPFDQPASPSDSDDDSIEDIDEQEIYGALFRSPPRAHTLLYFRTPLRDLRSLENLLTFFFIQTSFPPSLIRNIRCHWVHWLS